MLKNSIIKNIETCNKTQEALEIAGRLKPDLILIELKLLHKVDTVFYQKLRAKVPGVIIIGLTLYTYRFNNYDPSENKEIDAIISRNNFADDIIQVVHSLSNH